MTTEEKLMLLRVQLYTAAQTLTGEHLDALRKLIAEIVVTLGMDDSDFCAIAAGDSR